MSRYGDSDWEKEGLFNDMGEFLDQTNSVASLMKIVLDAIEDYESD